MLWVSIPNAETAPVLLYSAVGSGCNTAYSNGYLEANRWVATRDITIGAINFVFGTQSTANFLTSRLYIFSDNATSNYPNNILATFTPDVISGQVERFVGSYSISAGTKFWVVPSVSASTLPWCYWPGITLPNMTLNGVVPDTSTSLSNTSFRKVYQGSATPPIAGSWAFTGDTNQIWQLSMEEAVSQFSGSLVLNGGVKTATYRTAIIITANVSSLSKVSFFANGKPISRCQSILSNYGTSTCSWNPSVRGLNKIYAKFVSANAAYSENISTTLDVMVSNRGSLR